MSTISSSNCFKWFGDMTNVIFCEAYLPYKSVIFSDLIHTLVNKDCVSFVYIH